MNRRGKPKRYSLIYADPPWHYKDQANAGKRGASHKYPTLTTRDLMRMPVENHCRADAVCFMWATWPMLEDALRVMFNWGFEYRTLGFIWVKLTKQGTPSMGMGHYTRANSEPCLIGVRGQGLTRASASVGQVIQEQRGKHSAKPLEVIKRIGKLYRARNRIELFSRTAVTGWDRWGIDAPKAGPGYVALKTFQPLPMTALQRIQAWP